MKKKLNIIQINGLRGILLVGFIACCLAAGFIVFPGWVSMQLWNLMAHYIEQVPTIGIIQGILLWGILAGAYFTFRKEKLIVCMKASDGLSDDELKAVFAEMKNQAKNDVFIKNMLKAHEAELKIRNLGESNIPKTDLSQENKEILNNKN